MSARRRKLNRLRRDWLMNLRVAGQSVRGRTGYAVTTFIPEDVLAALRARPERVPEFIKLVASELVARAMKGLWNVNSRGAVSALIFEDVSNPRAGLQPVGVCFDTPNGPDVILVNKQPNRKQIK